MNSHELKMSVLPSLLAGTSRRSLVVDGLGPDRTKAALRALSLAGQAMRFERPAMAGDWVVEVPFPNQRRTLPERARRPLIRLLRRRPGGEDVELTLAWTFERMRFRPHPFDLPRLASFVRSHAERLGAGAQQWLAEQSESVRVADYFGDEALDDANWAAATLGRRAKFIAERRRQDAAAARGLVEAAWAREDAEARMRILSAMQEGLGEGDREFLAALSSDRAPRVRALAERLLSRLPGPAETGPAPHPALRECLQRIAKTRTGILKRRTVLTLELPATVKEHMAKMWVRETFAHVSLHELARGLDMSPEETIDTAAEADQDGANLLLGMAVMATQDGRIDLLEHAAAHLGDAWERMTQTGAVDLSALPAGERLRWAEALAKPYGAKPPASYAAWSWMLRAIEGPLPGAVTAPVLGSGAWISALVEEGKRVPEWMELLACCCGVEQRAALRHRFAEVDAGLTVGAVELMDILDAMERVDE